MEKLVPKLRFPEFELDWKIKKFNSLYSFKSTNSFSRDNLNFKNGEIKNIHYGDIHTKFNSLFDITKEEVPFINSDIDLSKIKEENYVEEGDLIIADASENYDDIGKMIEVINVNNEKLVAGLHTFLAKKINKTKGIGFTSNLVKSWRVREQIMKIAQGTKVLSLSTSRLGEIDLIIPEISEQQKIATFLTSVDERITLLEKQKQGLETYKKGVMQQLFSQQLRFKDDAGNDFPDWEKKKLGEVCEKKSSNISANSLENNSGNYKIYGATGFLQFVDFYQEENEYISIVKDGAGVGRTLLCDSKSSVLGTLDKISPKLKIDIYFLFITLNNIDFAKYSIGSTIPHIYFKDYSKEKIKLPCLEEQQKIASFLSEIDSRIEVVGKQIEQSKVFKKGLLQQMFV